MPKPYKKGGRPAGGGATIAVKHALPCKYFQRGKCNNPNCPYLHVKAASTGTAVQRRADAAAGTSADTDVTRTMLTLFFEKHQHAIYNAEARMLNLNALATQAELAEIAGSINFNARGFCEALCQCITSCIIPPPSIIAFEDNDISSVYHLANAMEETNMQTTLQAVSFANNKIKSCDFAKELKNFTNLVELNLLGNPAAELQDYKQRVKKLLPFLVLLDTCPLMPAPLALPWPTFYNVSEVEGAVPGAAPGRPQAYDSVQKRLLHFIQTAVLNPLEQEPGSVPSGTVTGVDAVSEAYSLNACLSISLSCPEAAVTTPASSSLAAGSGANGGAGLRSMVREIVGFRIRQTESDHNLVRGGARVVGAKAAQVATGRTQVCAQLEHWLYPKTFTVGHYIHASPDVAVLDNNGMGPHAPVQFKEPVSVVTLHGVMVWRFRADGPHANAGSGAPASVGVSSFAPAAPVDRSVVLIKRNFSRVLTVVLAGAGDKWQIANDMISLYPFSGSAEAEDGDVAVAASALCTASPSPSSLSTGAGCDDGQLRGTGLSLEGGMFADLNPYDVVFSPSTDPKRAAAMARQYRVPVPVVAVVTRSVHSDAELAAVLSDVQGVPLSTFEHAASLAKGDAMAGVYLTRLHQKYGIDPASTGLQLLTQFGLDWAAVESAIHQQQ